MKWYEEPTQEKPFEFRPCGEYEVTIRDIIRVTHSYTEKLRISIVRDWVSEKDLPKGCKIIPKYLSENVFGTEFYEHGNPESEEVKRILKYYGDCPCWNLCSNTERLTWKGVVPVLEVHVHFRDLKQSFIQEKKDVMNAKRRKKK